MRGYLETMGVTELAIEAHEKGEVDHDTIHQILISSDRYSITKKSLVNDLSEEFLLGVESKQQLPSLLKGGDGGREKSTLAASDGPRHLRIMTRMPTMNGVAELIETKTINDEGNYVQILALRNATTGKSHKTTRMFLPLNDALLM